MAPLIRILLASAFVTKDHNNHRPIDVRGGNNNNVELWHTTASSRVSLLSSSSSPSFVGTRGKNLGYRRQHEVLRMAEDDESTPDHVDDDALKMVEEIVSIPGDGDKSIPNDDGNYANISADDEESNTIQEDVNIISDDDEITSSDGDESVPVGEEEAPRKLKDSESITQSSASDDDEASRIAGEVETSDEDGNDDDDEESPSSSSDDYTLSQLCDLFGATQLKDGLLSLQTDSDGIRGVYVSDAVGAGEVLLRMPLRVCLRDDEPPAWLGGDGDDDDASGDSYVSVEGWVTRLTASLLDVHQRERHDERTSRAMRMWLGSLPGGDDLRGILPVHWDEDLLEASGSRALQLAVDSAYFARSGPLGDIRAALIEGGVVAGDDTVPASALEEALESALDLVQTRSCRAAASDGGGGTQRDVRVLAPVFDMINHSREPNAEFFREGEDLVVRTIRDLRTDDQVFISYGASTVPAWKCLFSYGFVPSTDDVYEDDVAEILLEDGTLVEIGPTEIPFELVRFASWSGRYDETKEEDDDEASGDGEMGLNPEIGQKIVDIITDAARKLEEPLIASTRDDDDGERDDAAAIRSINDLRRSNRRTLLACAGGLREFLESSM